VERVGIIGFCRKTYGKLLGFGEFHGKPWLFMVVYGCEWLFMVVYVFLVENSMGNIVFFYIVFGGKSIENLSFLNRKTRENQWKTAFLVPERWGFPSRPRTSRVAERRAKHQILLESRTIPSKLRRWKSYGKNRLQERG
jgi:hypothetical protein